MSAFLPLPIRRLAPLAALSGFLAAPLAGAQSVVVFANRVSSSSCGPVNAPIYGPQAGCPGDMLRGQGTNNGGMVNYTGPLLEGTGYTAALYVGPAGTPESSLTLLGQTTFRTAALAGYVVNTTLPLPAFAPGTPLTFQVRAWDNQHGTLGNWAAAMAYQTTPVGTSALFTPACPAPPPGQGQTFYLAGLTSFNLFLPGSNVPFGIADFTTNVAASPGGTATLSARLTSCQAGGMVTQQWSRAGTPITGATNVSLVLSNLSYPQAGAYTFSAGDTLGMSTQTRTARLDIAPRLTGISKPPGIAAALNYQSAPGSTVSVQFATALNVGGWGTLGTATSATTNGAFNDAGATNSSRIYRLRLEP